MSHTGDWTPTPSRRWLRSPRLRALIVIVAILSLALAVWAAWAGSRPPLFVAQFGGPDRLLTNEYALHNPHARGIARSSQWFVTSGSLFIRSGAATNGRLDHIAPNAHSSNGTNSAIFRAYTRQRFLRDYRVTFDLRVRAPRYIAGMRVEPWDGVHLIVNAESASAAYYVSLYRRDGLVVIKKKTTGGPVAGGSYQALSKYLPGRIRPDQWTQVRVDVRQASPGSITIDFYEAGTLLATATDDPTISGSPPYTSGRLGIRADKANFAIKDLIVHQL